MYLLDTHSILWFLRYPKRLSEEAAKAITEAPALSWSPVTLFEIAIKVSRNDPEFQFLRGWAAEMTSALADLGAKELPISSHHSETLSLLPFHHRDPFDRMLIAQAQTEKLTLISRDSIFEKYDVKLLW